MIFARPTSVAAAVTRALARVSSICWLVAAFSLNNASWRFRVDSARSRSAFERGNLAFRNLQRRLRLLHARIGRRDELLLRGRHRLGALELLQ